MLFGGGNNFLGTIFGSEEKTETVKNTNVQTPSDVNKQTSTTSPVANQASDLSALCRHAVNLEKPECVKWFDDLSKNNSSVDSTGQVVQTVSYNPSKPYDFDQQEIQVTPTDFPRMSGVVKMANGRLMAIDQQGNYMQSVSQNDCKNGFRVIVLLTILLKNNNQQNECLRVNKLFKILKLLLFDYKLPYQF